MFKTLNEFIIIGLWWVEYFNTEEKGKATVTDLDPNQDQTIEIYKIYVKISKTEG